MADVCDRRVEGERADARGDRGDLHRDVVDVGAAEPGEDLVEPASGLVVADDRLAEDVHVAPDTFGAPLREVLSERGVVGGKDDLCGLETKPPQNERHHETRQDRGEPSTDVEHEAVEPSKAAKVGVVDELEEPSSRRCGNGDARNLVGEANGEVSRVGIPHERADAGPVAALAPPLTRFEPRGLVHQLSRQCDGLVDAPFVGRRSRAGSACVSSRYLRLDGAVGGHLPFVPGICANRGPRLAVEHRYASSNRETSSSTQKFSAPS